MKPPDSADVHETSTSKYWFVDGIIHIVVKDNVSADLEQRKGQVDEFRKKLGGKKLFAVIDVSGTHPTSRANREYHSKTLPEIFNAIAFVSKTPLGKMLAHLYLGNHPLTIPCRIFSSEETACNWLREFLPHEK